MSKQKAMGSSRPNKFGGLKTFASADEHPFRVGADCTNEKSKTLGGANVGSLGLAVRDW